MKGAMKAKAKRESTRDAVPVSDAVRARVGVKLRRLAREGRPLAKAALAERLGIARDTLYRVLSGEPATDRVAGALRDWARAA